MSAKRLGLMVALLLIIASFAPLVSAAPAAQEAKPFTIGVIGATDGPTARGVQVAVNRLNANGAFTIAGTAYTVAVSVVEASNADAVKKAVTELKEAGVVAIFGPDDDDLARQTQPDLVAAGIPVFAGATHPDFRPEQLVFRTRSSDSIQMAALAEYLVNDLKQTNIVVYQGAETYSGKASAFTLALAERNLSPGTVLLQTGELSINETARTILEGLPQVIVAFGTGDQIAQLYPALRNSGFAGKFASNVTTDPAYVAASAGAQRTGLLGVTNWAYSSIRKDSMDFVADYKAAFGDNPQGESAAAYDAAVAAVLAYRFAGKIDAKAAVQQLIGFGIQDSIQGKFDPTRNNNELSADASVVELDADGTPRIVLRLRGADRLPPEDATPTPIPTEPPTATPDGVIATVTSATLNIRSGPSLEFARLGQLRRGNQVRLTGANADYTWFTFTYRGQEAWLLGEFLSIFGDVKTLPIKQGPPPPTAPPITATPTGQPFPDIVMVNAVLNPAVPQPGIPFTMTVTLQNQGAVNAGEFAIATSFKPGDVYTAAVVPGIVAGQQAAVNLTATVGGTAVDSIAIVIDLNSQLDEGPAGEANNKPTFAYKIDRPYVNQGSVTLTTGQQFDVDGGGVDLTFNGATIDPIAASSALAQLGIPFTSLHYDLLASTMGGVGNGLNSIGNPQPGTIIGVRTTSGKFAVVQVMGFTGGSIQFNFYVYP